MGGSTAVAVNDTPHLNTQLTGGCQVDLHTSPQSYDNHPIKGQIHGAEEASQIRANVDGQYVTVQLAPR
jgi:hypothetical protein